MRDIDIHDRYAQTPPDGWIGCEWLSTRTAACGCALRGTVRATRPGAVRVQWHPCPHWMPSWESTDRGTLTRT